MKNQEKSTEERIIELLEENKIIRRKEIYLALSDISRSTLDYHLTKMKGNSEITLFSYPEYVKCGINLEDRKARYIALPQNAKKIRYYNSVIGALNSRDKKKREDALREIENVKKFHLLPFQLTKLSKFLRKADIKISNKIVKVIREHIEKQIKPSNLRKIENNLEKN